MGENILGERLMRVEVQLEIAIQTIKKLEQKQEKTEEQRRKDHKEVLQSLSQKLDVGAPSRWAGNFQHIVRYGLWLVGLALSFGAGNFFGHIPG